MIECETCKQSFDNEKGLLTHRGMMHPPGVGGKQRLPPPTQVRPVQAIAIPPLNLDNIIRKAPEIGEKLGEIWEGFQVGIFRGFKKVHARKAQKPSHEQLERG